MQEYRVEIKVKNNLILKKVEEFGYKSLPQFCKQIGLSYGRLLAFINMKESIFDHRGDIKKSVLNMCDKLNCMPEELFTTRQMEAELETNKRTFQVNEAEMKFMLESNHEPLQLEDLVMDNQKTQALEKALDVLRPKEKRILNMRFKEGCTLEECAVELGISRERARQIEIKALRKLRHPGFANELREFI